MKKSGERGQIMEKQIKVRFEHSTIGCPPVQRKTVLGLGLKRLNQVRILKDTPAIRGMVLKIPHLVSIVEELMGTCSSTKQPAVSAAATSAAPAKQSEPTVKTVKKVASAPHKK